MRDSDYLYKKFRNMNTATIREKLCEYIRVADDRKVRAIFTIIENDVIEPYKWWNDNELLTELDNRSKQIKSGNDPGMLWEEAKKEILSNSILNQKVN